jgi:hypothetical protein
MPEPLVTFSVVKFLWEESKSVRGRLWRKLPFAKDAEKRSLAEKELGRLLDDANKLAKTLAPSHAEAAIAKRLAQFEEALLEANIPADQVAVLVERGSLYVKTIVTEPALETAGLRVRLADLESSVQSLETELEKNRLDHEAIQAMLRSQKQDKSLPALWIGFGILLLVELTELLFLLLHLEGGSR